MALYPYGFSPSDPQAQSYHEKKKKKISPMEIEHPTFHSNLKETAITKRSLKRYNI